jgi:hypothetical protein
MRPFWRNVIRPFLMAFDAPVIVEVGAAAGKMTTLLLEFAASRRGTVHIIDPAPQFDADLFAERFGSCMELHKACSHSVLDDLPPADAVLIDGDHNWYTVYGELQRLEATVHREAANLPLILLHDVAWPYGRRDMYYSPDRIPEQWRQPWARRGIAFGEIELLDDGGMNRGLANALKEGGPRNGVLTAVEDFIAESELPLEFQKIPGFGGLGLLASRELLDSLSLVRDQWEYLMSPRFIAWYADILATRMGPQMRAAHAELRHRLR